MRLLIAFLFLTSAANAPVCRAHYDVPLPAALVGVASWYGAPESNLIGRPMANGQPFNPNRLTAASYIYPLGAQVTVENLANGRVVQVTITDRGPARRLGRVIDLSRASAERLGYIERGTAMVSVYQ